MVPSSQAAEELENLLALLEQGKLNGFPEFLNRARHAIYRHGMLHRFVLGQPSAQVWLMVFSAVCHQRPQVLSQMILGSSPKPDESIVRDIGRGLGYREDQIIRLIQAVAKQRYEWKRQPGTSHDIDWGVIQTVAREKPTQHKEPVGDSRTANKPKAPRHERQPRKPAAAAPAPASKIAPIGPPQAPAEVVLGKLETDLAQGKIIVQEYYAQKRAILGLSITSLATQVGIEAFKLARLEHDASYHLGWSDLKKLGIALGVSPSLLRQAHNTTEGQASHEVEEKRHATGSIDR